MAGIRTASVLLLPPLSEALARLRARPLRSPLLTTPTMRRFLPVVLLPLLGACATAPISYVAATPRPAPDAYTCVLAKVNELGYTITNTNKEAGFITATKQTSGLGTQLLTGSKYHDQLTISIFEDGTGARRIRATSGQTQERSNLFGTSSSGIKPSDKGKADANAVLVACGQGPIVQQASRQFAVEATATE